MQLALLSSSVDRASSSRQTSGDAAIPIGNIPFGGSAESAQARQRELEQILNLTLSTEESNAYLYNFLPRSSSESYNRCIEQVFGYGQLQLTSRVLDEANSLVSFNWPGRPGETGTYVLRVRSNGTSEARNTVIAASGGPIAIVVSRVNPARTLTVIAELVRTDDRDAVPVSSATAVFPPVIRYRQLPPVVKTVRSLVSEASCGRAYARNHHVGPTVYLRASPGATLSRVTFEELPPPDALHLRAISSSDYRAGLIIDSQTLDEVSGHAECGVGDGRYKHWMSGFLTATETLITVERVEPEDNGELAPIRQILPAPSTPVNP